MPNTPQPLQESNDQSSNTGSDRKQLSLLTRALLVFALSAIANSCAGVPVKSDMPQDVDNCPGLTAPDDRYNAIQSCEDQSELEEYVFAEKDYTLVYWAVLKIEDKEVIRRLREHISSVKTLTIAERKDKETLISHLSKLLGEKPEPKKNKPAPKKVAKKPSSGLLPEIPPEALAQVRPEPVRESIRDDRLPRGMDAPAKVIEPPKIHFSGADVNVATSGPGPERKVPSVDLSKSGLASKFPESKESNGVLDEAAVKIIIQRKFHPIKACYERSLKRNLNLSGKIVVEFTVDKEGKVTNARAIKNDLNTDVETCILSVFKKLTFPKPEGGEATIEYPFLFTPSN